MDKTLKAFLKSQDLHPKQLYKLAPGTLIEDFLKFQKDTSTTKQQIINNYLKYQ
jgi:hypothetical protein